MSIYKQCQFQVQLNLQDKVVTGSKRESTTPGETFRSFSRKGLVTHRIGSYTSDSIQDVNTYKAFGDTNLHVYKVGPAYQ